METTIWQKIHIEYIKKAQNFAVKKQAVQLEMGKRYEQILHQREYSDGIRKMQIKAMMKFPYTPTRRAKIKIMTISNAGEDSEKLDLSCTGGRNVKWHCHSEK